MKEDGGIGFAAIQMGLPYRVFAMQIDSGVQFYYNPEILSFSEETSVLTEGCLSFPELFFKVTRPSDIQVRYQNSLGIFHEENLTGITSRCYQHEIDHLNGICFVDRVSKLTLDMALKKREKRRRKKNVL